MDFLILNFVSFPSIYNTFFCSFNRHMSAALISFNKHVFYIFQHILFVIVVVRISNCKGNARFLPMFVLNKVLPQPVGPSNKTLLFCNSTSSGSSWWFILLKWLYTFKTDSVFLALWISQLYMNLKLLLFSVGFR